MGTTLLLAAVFKSSQPAETLSVMMHLLGRPFTWPATTFLVLIEVVLGSVLVAGVARRLAGVVACALLLSLAGWIVWLRATGLPLGCGCGTYSGAVAHLDPLGFAVTLAKPLLMLLLLAPGLAGNLARERRHREDPISASRDLKPTNIAPGREL